MILVDFCVFRRPLAAPGTSVERTLRAGAATQTGSVPAALPVRFSLATATLKLLALKLMLLTKLDATLIFSRDKRGAVKKGSRPDSKSTTTRLETFKLYLAGRPAWSRPARGITRRAHACEP